MNELAYLTTADATVTSGFMARLVWKLAAVGSTCIMGGALILLAMAVR